jgi:hypothetical protein
MYAYVTQTKVEFYDKHIEAFERYSNSKTRIKGVFDIRGRSIQEVNISANHWDGTFIKLLNKLKEELKKEQDEIN